MATPHHRPCSRRSEPAPSDQVGLSACVRGAVYIEFIIAFIPVMTLFLGLVQLALTFTAQLVVTDAAIRAARSAVVVLDDDPARYDDAERGLLEYEGNSGQSSQGALNGLATQLGVGQGAGSVAGFGSGSGNARIAAIRRAAYMPLATLAPSLSQLSRSFGLGGAGVAGDLGNGGRFLAGLMLYNKAAAMVTLRKGGQVANDIASDELVTVRVTYLYYCGIPIANMFICDSLAGLSGLSAAQDAVQDVANRVRDGDIAGAASGAANLRQTLRDTTTQFNETKEELSWAESPELLTPFALTGARFTMLTAEASLPNQGACYYPGSSCYRGP